MARVQLISGSLVMLGENTSWVNQEEGKKEAKCLVIYKVIWFIYEFFNLCVTEPGLSAIWFKGASDGTAHFQVPKKGTIHLFKRKPT